MAREGALLRAAGREEGDQAVTQVLPEEIDLPGRAHNIRGGVFGALTALRPVGNGQRGVLWLCECECGRHAIRTTAALRRAAKNGEESQCIECLHEMSRGRANVHADRWREFYLLRWYEHGSLYTDGQLKMIEQRITDDLRTIEFPVGEPPPDVLDGHGYDQPEPYGGISDEIEYTLVEIAAEFDVARSRIGQICSTAMGKLLHKHRRLLVSLFTGEFDWQPSRINMEMAPGFSGCRCKNYDRSAPGYIYCRTCWKVWQVDESQTMRILTDAVIRKSTIIEDVVAKKPKRRATSHKTPAPSLYKIINRICRQLGISAHSMRLVDTHLVQNKYTVKEFAVTHMGRLYVILNATGGPAWTLTANSAELAVEKIESRRASNESQRVVLKPDPVALAKISDSLQRQLVEQHNTQTRFVGAHLVQNK